MTVRPTTYLIHIVLAAIALQATIPVGYMPGNIADGTFVEFCPAGVSAEVMAAIAGHTTDHHEHSETGSEFLQCDLGGGPGAALLDNVWADGTFFETTTALRPASNRLILRTNHRIGYQPRSPPIS